MKLHKVYSNKENIFPCIVFELGLNVIVGITHSKSNKDKDTHNLGKTTFGQVLDYCLLKEIDNNSFIKKSNGKLDTLIFFLEILLDNGCYVTIRRSVKDNSKISLIKTSTPIDNANLIDDDQWLHHEIPIRTAKDVLNSYLEWDIDNSYNYRKILTYCLRGQNDYTDIVRVKQFMMGEHRQWKPFVSDAVGLNANIVTNIYNVRCSIDDINRNIDGLSTQLSQYPYKSGDELSNAVQDLNSKRTTIKNSIDSLNFAESEQNNVDAIVNKLDNEIAYLKHQIYLNKAKQKQIDDSLRKKKDNFDINKLKNFFDEVGFYFPQEIEKTLRNCCNLT